jgi:acetyltransferase
MRRCGSQAPHPAPDRTASVPGYAPADDTHASCPCPVGAGDIAFPHSGAICEAVIDWARGQGFGLSRLVSLGNQMDLTEGELLPTTVADPNTRVVAMYLEGVRNGRLFVENARKATRKSRCGDQSRRSGSGRGGGVAYRRAGRRDVPTMRFAGGDQAQSTEKCSMSRHSWCPVAANRRIGVLTNAGGRVPSPSARS